MAFSVSRIESKRSCAAYSGNRNAAALPCTLQRLRIHGAESLDARPDFVVLSAGSPPARSRRERSRPSPPPPRSRRAVPWNWSRPGTSSAWRLTNSNSICERPCCVSCNCRRMVRRASSRPARASRKQSPRGQPLGSALGLYHLPAAGWRAGPARYCSQQPGALHAQTLQFLCQFLAPSLHFPQLRLQSRPGGMLGAAALLQTGQLRAQGCVLLHHPEASDCKRSTSSRAASRARSSSRRACFSFGDVALGDAPLRSARSFSLPSRPIRAAPPKAVSRLSRSRRPACASHAPAPGLPSPAPVGGCAAVPAPVPAHDFALRPSSKAAIDSISFCLV